MTLKEKYLEKIKEDVLLTYQNILNDKLLDIKFDESVLNNFFSWNYDALIVNHDLASNVFKTNFLAFFPSRDEIADSHHELLMKLRPCLDLACCYQMFHNHKMHIAYYDKLITNVQIPFNPIKLFDELERARVIACASHYFAGIVANIVTKIEQDLDSSAIFAIDLIFLFDFVDNFPISSKKTTIKNIEYYSAKVKKILSAQIITKIQALKNFIDDQQIFSDKSLDIINNLIIDFALNKDVEAPNDSLADSPTNHGEKTNNIGTENIESNYVDEQNSSSENEASQATLEQTTEEKINFIDKIAPENSVEIKSYHKNKNNENDYIEFINPYKIFTSKYDEIIFPKKFLSRAELENLRHQLDLKIAKLANISKKISLKLKRKLLSKANNVMDFDVNNGVLNRKRFANLIASPFIEDIWVNNKFHQYHDTALTILLDNSGSMRGNPIIMSAMACEIIAGILEKFSIKTEIIGFTTADWKGGRAKKQWEMSMRPKNPGRLNELRHIVYKDFNQSFKKAKINLGLMLKEGILKENIDGEALLFARYRLMQQNEKRKILMVISDGTPVDDSTTTYNDSEILINHLRHVINIIEKQGKIEIIGIGIGHTTDEFYKNSITIKTLEELGDVMIDKLINLL